MVIQIFQRAWQLLLSPWQSSEGLWMVLPLLLILILIHIYFGRYRTEEIGWGSAFGNSISLLWIIILLYKFLFTQHGIGAFKSEWGKFTILIFLTIWVFLMLTINFFHWFNKTFAFIISSANAVYVGAYIAIAVVLGSLPFDRYTLAGAIILFIILTTFIQTVKHITPMTRNAASIIHKREEHEKRVKAGKKSARKKKWHKFWK